jgi:nickel-dependent lactate racemase
MPLNELMKLIRNGEVSASGGAFDYCYAKAMNRNQVVLVSDNYSESEAHDLGLSYAGSVQEAVDNALANIGSDGKVSVLPVGGLTVPLVE